MVDDTFFSVTLPTLEDLSCLCYHRMMIKSCLFLWKKTVSSTQRHTMCIVLDSGETELRKRITTELNIYNPKYDAVDTAPTGCSLIDTVIVEEVGCC